MEKKKILLVDDDPDLILAFEAILISRGYNVATALSKNEGLDKQKSFQPDLAILDVMMDDEHDGFDLARQLKQEIPELPVIMLTGISEVTGINFRAAAADPEWLPADEYLDKPVDPDELVNVIEELLSKDA